MKKSKIVIPALALIGFSAVASVTGTVAWFTAQRTGNITTNNFVVTKTDGSLDVTCAPLVGTKQGANSTTINALDNADPAWTAKLTDASFNPVTKQLYSDGSVNAETGAGTSFVTVGNGTSYKTAPVDGAHVYDAVANDHIYYAFTWSVKVRYNWEGDTRAVNVLFNYTDSTMTASNADESALVAQETAKGFRIAIISDANTVVWSKLNTVDNFVTTTGLTASDTASYGENLAGSYSFFGSDKYGKGGDDDDELPLVTSYTKAADNEADQDKRADYLATLDVEHKTENQNYTEQTFYCVAWFEGNDYANVKNGKVLQAVQSAVHFYTAIDGAHTI